ncbi:MAG: Protein transport protein Sec23A [Paramarteilia canceri]
MSSFADEYQKDGVRLAWNIWPHPSLATLQTRSSSQIAAQLFSNSDSVGMNSVGSGNGTFGGSSSRLPLPISALYAPAYDISAGNKRDPSTLRLNSVPQLCSRRDCRAIINPFW